jgi:hypothetical protein
VAKSKNARQGASDRPSDDVLIARARVHLAIVWIVGIFVGLVGLGVLSLMAVPLAHAIAGKHTDFGFTVSVSFNAALTASTVLTGGGLIIQSRRVSRYKSRNKTLEQSLKVGDRDLTSKGSRESQGDS